MVMAKEVEKSNGGKRDRKREKASRILNITRGNCRSVRGCKVRDTRDKRTRIKCRRSNRLVAAAASMGCLRVIALYTNDFASPRARDLRIEMRGTRRSAVNRARSI